MSVCNILMICDLIYLLSLFGGKNYDYQKQQGLPHIFTGRF